MVTIGLASHWPCGTDFSGLSTYGLNGHRKGDEHPACAPTGAWSILPFLPKALAFRCMKCDIHHKLLETLHMNKMKSGDTHIAVGILLFLKPPITCAGPREQPIALTTEPRPLLHR